MKKFAVFVLVAAMMVLTFALVMPVSAAEHCADASYIPPTQFESFPAVGQVAQQYSSVRSEPGGVVEAIMVAGQDFTVNGITCAGAHHWLEIQVDTADGAITGYVAEGYEGQYWVQPDEDMLVNVSNAILDPVSKVLYHTGEQCGRTPASVSGDLTVQELFSTLRAGVNSSQIAYVLTHGDTVTVVDGTGYCGIGPHNWISVTFGDDATVYWVAQSTTYDDGARAWLQ